MAKTRKVSAPDTIADGTLKDKMEQVALLVADAVLCPAPTIVNGREVARPLPLDETVDALKALTNYYATIKKLPPPKDDRPKFAVIDGGSKPNF